MLARTAEGWYGSALCIQQQQTAGAHGVDGAQDGADIARVLGRNQCYQPGMLARVQLLQAQCWAGAPLPGCPAGYPFQPGRRNICRYGQAGHAAAQIAVCDELGGEFAGQQLGGIAQVLEPGASLDRLAHMADALHHEQTRGAALFALLEQRADRA